MTVEKDVASLRDELALAQEDIDRIRRLFPLNARQTAEDGHAHVYIVGRPAVGTVPNAGEVWSWSETNKQWELAAPGTPGAHAHTGPAHTGLTPDNHHAASHLHSAHPGTSDSHHLASHLVASHSDTSATGTQLDAVTDGGEVDIEHTHRLTTYITIGSETGDGISYTV